MKFFFMLCCLFAGIAAAVEPPKLHPQLEVFRPYLGQYWQGDLAQPGSEKPAIDLSHWSRALNGQAIKTVHSINDGEYGGESFIFWDDTKKSLAYYYFTTAGFYTHGTMQVNPQSGEITALENVENNQNGITQVKSHSKLMPDGSLQVRSSYLQNEQWVDGHSALYQPVAPQEIIFK
ncbi:hypothetical protein SAMN06297280_2973 [Arsukibacterium tuosuense]|uniref:Secreted protein n=1 Tax=Arsukibacterium tuosuense TaxID=1323745 RepID=A0A285J631_9GAMM|nr:hypothetical protein [Arsukibacterium tuosuense]SNY55779.1 hypothetical protein SAMN06297280_2973 [Arsukibacterium tuosuense]